MRWARGMAASVPMWLWILVNVKGVSVFEKSFMAPRTAWDYSTHGAAWPGLCQTDSRQSPIDLPPIASASADPRPFYFRYPHWEQPVTLYNDGLAISFTLHDKVGGFGVGHEFTLLDESWSLQQATIHAPSEHTWGGSHLPVELQLVHVSASRGENAVVSIGFDRGSVHVPDLFWDSLLANGLPINKGDEVRTNDHSPQALDFGILIGDDAEMLEYEGSVTIPPCTPNTKYFVRAEPLQTNPEHLENIIATIRRSSGQDDGNYRITQALNNRNVTLYTAKDATGMETTEEFSRRAYTSGAVAPTAPPSVLIPENERDTDNEDAARTTDDAKLNYWYSDPTGDAVAAAAQNLADTHDVLAAYSEEEIMNPSKEEVIITGFPAVVAAADVTSQTNVEITTALQNVDTANEFLIAAQQARDYSEGKTNLTTAEQQLMQAQEEVAAKQRVADALQTRLQSEKEVLLKAKGDAHGHVFWAKKRIEIRDELIANGTAVRESAAEVSLPSSYQLPGGDYVDPFSANTAEFRSRITTGPLPRHLNAALAPNHRHIANTVSSVVSEPSQDMSAEAHEAPTGAAPPSEDEPVVVEALQSKRI